ncbi:MAG: hypothetical protein OXQ86_12180, partial [Gammaproteobacteria bacterium]|nr:hypothetical protein [Gammaproteobacteria bacterium]
MSLSEDHHEMARLQMQKRYIPPRHPESGIQFFVSRMTGGAGTLSPLPSPTLWRGGRRNQVVEQDLNVLALFGD